MSVAHVVAAVVATPTPSPEIIKTVFTNTVPAQVPAVVVQASQVAGVFVAGLLVSAAHRIAEVVIAKEKGWGPKFNTLLTSGYTVLIGLVGVATAHQLGTGLSSAVALVLSTGVASIGTFWGYAVKNKFIGSLLSAQTQTVIPPVLATDGTPAG